MYRFFVLSCIALTAALSACSTTRQAAPDNTIKTSSVIAPEERKLAYAGDDATP
ncbi:polysaccharide deacetylase family protein, partial [Rhizobium ruizarguesonis]